MAVICIEGFDHLSLAQLATKAGISGTGGSGSVASGRLGGQCWKSIANQSGQLVKAFPSTAGPVIIGFAFKHEGGIGNGIDHLLVRGGTTNIVRMYWDNSGAFPCLKFRNAGGTLLGSTATQIVDGIWYYVELKITIHASAGALEVRMNGAADISATSLNTGSTSADNWWFGVSGIGSLPQVSMDDVYVADTTGGAPNNDFLGDTRVETLVLTAEGANTAWTASSGTKVAAIDQTTSHDDDTDYIVSTTPGDRETFTATALSVTSGSVFGVQVNLAARKDDAGTRTIAPVIRMSGTNHDGTAVGLTTSYLVFSQLYNQDPNGSNWTVSSVNAAEWGVKEVA